jgi:hypothetical protein
VSVAKRAAVFTSLVTCLSGCYHSAKPIVNPLKWCRSQQLTVKLVAIDAPGMSRLNSIYALINHSNVSCRIASDQLQLWSLHKHRRVLVPYSVPPQKNIFYRLKPQSSESTMRFKNTVWFAVTAWSLGPPSFTHWSWSINHDNQQYNLPYHSNYTDNPQRTPIHQGLTHWRFDKTCRDESSRLIHLKPQTVVNLSRIFSCG